MEIQNSGKFRLVIAGEEAVCEYYFKDHQTMVFPHTFVPPAHRGKGIATKLIKAALEFARTNHFTVIPLCSAVIVYIQRHPEYQSLLKK